MDDSTDKTDPNKALNQILESARSLGVEMDEEEALQWLTAIAATEGSGDPLQIDKESGVFGHRVVLLDFDPTDMDRIRRVAAIVELEDRPNVETAIALSGSSAQSHVQTFPGDFDYFERVNIKADSKKEACQILGEVIRDKALAFASGTGYQLIDVRFGSFQEPVVRDGKHIDTGGSIVWSISEIRDGQFEVLTPDGDPKTIDWDYACQDPGWCKIDWVLVDPGQPRAVKASNMLDSTWEKDDGELVPLDGFIDPYYQEVYLDAESIPLFSKIAQKIGPGSQAAYVEQLEGEIKKYSGEDHPNHGKVAKRMYNIFRLTGRYEEAAYVRELFDEPAALLYQVSALLEGLIELGSDPESIDPEVLRQQIDQLMQDVIRVVEGPSETGLVMALLRVRDDITNLKKLDDRWASTLLQLQLEINEQVNEYFRDRLHAVPKVASYLDGLRE